MKPETNTSQQKPQGCKFCKGNGWILIAGNRTLCPKCQGTGKIQGLATK